MKVTCPHHKVHGAPERTPSLHLYPDGGYFCYACSATGLISDLEGNHQPPPEAPKEDVAASLARIRGLPLKPFRGLSVACDTANRAYLVFPGEDYYICRNPEGVEPKYKAPSGHSVPLYKATTGNSGVLLYVEGALNAMSIATVVGGQHTVVSPGSTTNFEKWLTFCREYSIIYLMVDKDEAGILAALKFKALLKKHVSVVHLDPWDRDANEILVNEGEEELRREITRRLGRL